MGNGRGGGGAQWWRRGPGEKIDKQKKSLLAYATFATRLIWHWGRPSIQVKHVVKHVVGG